MPGGSRGLTHSPHFLMWGEEVTASVGDSLKSLTVKRSRSPGKYTKLKIQGFDFFSPKEGKNLRMFICFKKVASIGS